MTQALSLLLNQQKTPELDSQESQAQAHFYSDFSFATYFRLMTSHMAGAPDYYPGCSPLKLPISLCKIGDLKSSDL